MPELRLIISVDDSEGPKPLDMTTSDPHEVADDLFGDHGPAWPVEVLEAEWAET